MPSNDEPTSAARWRALATSLAGRTRDDNLTLVSAGVAFFGFLSLFPALIALVSIVLRTLEERDIRFVRLWFTDVLGTLKSVSVAPAELEAAFDEGIGFDGSAIEGFARVFESDMVAMPDPTTFQVFPFEGGVSGESARMFCNILLPDGSPSWADPRHVLRRGLSRAAEKGY